ncbi:single-stranded DNA-binding protein [Pseudomonas sp. StFLB209]|uniref:DUF2528 family protein n=1 Tax=Pseudomonas sp. StFLB209 TaxID=1028989 RepID=UPI0004F68F06|nr:DUF2528 family protein [Pseudomonas sp. StFLB209]BAP41317.1 single-stranded DNA-binding protein [Pseudomonas sp. StFLB209]
MNDAPNDSSTKATTPAIRRYQVLESFKDYEVTLEVDHSILTQERATQINSFWTSDDDRLDEENGDVVRTVIRLAGLTLIKLMLELGDVDFSDKEVARGNIWSTELRRLEGWGGELEGSPYGWCGIRAVSASVSSCSFYELEVREVS